MLLLLNIHTTILLVCSNFESCRAKIGSIWPIKVCSRAGSDMSSASLVGKAGQFICKLSTRINEVNEDRQRANLG